MKIKRRHQSVSYEGGDEVDVKDISVEEASDVDRDGNPRPELWEYIRFDGHRMLYKITVQNWGKMGLLVAPIYIYHLLWCIAGINAYADYTR